MLMLRSNDRKANEMTNIWEQLLTREFPEFFTAKPQYAMPNVNISEMGQAYTIELAAPGLSKEDFAIELDERVLKIAVNKTEERQEAEKVHRKEFSYFKFERHFTLPEDADVAKIQAEYQNGVLKLTVPKHEKEQAIKGRKITIA